MMLMYRLIYVLPFVTAVCLLLIFSSTNPLDIGPAGILAVFFLTYVFFASIGFIVLHWGLAVASRFLKTRSIVTIKHQRIGARKAYYMASVIAFGPVLLLALQSVGQLQLRDVLLTIAFIALATFYVVKRT